MTLQLAKLFFWFINNQFLIISFSIFLKSTKTPLHDKTNWTGKDYITAIKVLDSHLLQFSTWNLFLCRDFEFLFMYNLLICCSILLQLILSKNLFSLVFKEIYNEYSVIFEYFNHSWSSIALLWILIFCIILTFQSIIEKRWWKIIVNIQILTPYKIRVANSLLFMNFSHKIFNAKIISGKVRFFDKDYLCYV